MGSETPLEPETATCQTCGREKPLTEFGWSKRKGKPTKRCISCWQSPDLDRLVPSMVGIYFELEQLMTQIRKATFEEIIRSELDETALRLVLRGMVERANKGDSNAARVLIDVRLKLNQAGDGSEEETVNLAQLLAQDPLATGGDTA